ncbi:hypothetical protein BDV18DRAFT_133202 [Aspergillus unguis]
MGNQYAESFSLLGIGLVFILLRVYVRWKAAGPSNFQLDDFLMPAAGVTFTIEVTLAYLVGTKYNGLTNSYMTDAERAADDPTSEEHYNRVMGSKIQVAGWSLYTMTLWLIKGSLAVFYSRLTTGLSHLPARVRFAYILLGVSYLGVALTLILSCQPMRKFWQINPDPGNVCQPARSLVYVLVVMIPNVLTDLYLLAIPLPLLWTVRIGMRRKVTLMGLFSGAIFVGVAAIVRAVIVITSGSNGAVEGSKWACRESFVSIVVSNLPIIQPLIRRGASKLGLSALFSSSGGPSSYGPSRRRGREGEYPLTSQDGSKMHSKKSRLRSKGGFGQSTFTGSVLNTTALGSDEQILVNGGNGQGKDGGITVTREMVVRTEDVEPGRDSGGSASGSGSSGNDHAHVHDNGQDSRQANQWDAGMRRP